MPDVDYNPADMAAALSARIMATVNDTTGADLKNLVQAYVLLRTLSGPADNILEVVFDGDSEEYAL